MKRATASQIQLEPRLTRSRAACGPPQGPAPCALPRPLVDSNLACDFCCESCKLSDSLEHFSLDVDVASFPWSSGGQTTRRNRTMQIGVAGHHRASTAATNNRTNSTLRQEAARGSHLILWNSDGARGRPRPLFEPAALVQGGQPHKRTR